LVKTWRFLGVCVLLFFSGSGECQDSVNVPLFEPRSEYPVAISFFAPLVFPKVLQDSYQLKEYVCSEEFRSFRRRYGDVRAVDALFNRAMTLCWNNVYEALLVSFICTIEHRNFGVKLPLVGALLWVPLTSEFPDEFRERVEALPCRLYADSPSDPSGDRDKLQHFFGSAFLSYTLESRGAAQRMGHFVEWGEDRFIVDGALDERDVRANVQGEDFGLFLLRDASVLPSRFLREGGQVSPKNRSCVPYNAEDSVRSLAEER
jgi:hypothetical protein